MALGARRVAGFYAAVDRRSGTEICLSTEQNRHLTWGIRGF